MLPATCSEVHSAFALVSLDHRVIFRNLEFSRLLPIHTSQGLPQEIAAELKENASQYNPPYDSVSAAKDLAFVILPQGVFRLEVSFLNHSDECGDLCLLLQLTPVVEPFSRINLLFQEGSLTRREMEIASLIRCGMDDQQIGARLFISIHTVKNHIKNVHQKLNVHNRGQLVAVLNH